MPLEDLPNGFTVPTRSEIRDNFQRDYLLRQPGAPSGEGSAAFIDGSVIADTLAPLYADASSIGRGANIDDMTREQLKAECRALGIPEELLESAGTGFVIITASAGGVFIDGGRSLLDEGRRLTFRCLVPDTYYDGAAVPVIGVDKGPTTNIPAGTKLKWNNPPAGLGNIATVQADADGNGFTGGRPTETDDDIRNRIKSTRKNTPAGGNDAQIIKLVREAGKNLGIPVQDVFVYPAITGSGHEAYVFTLRPGKPGDSRVPNDVQIAAVRAYVINALPKDDGIFSAEVLEQGFNLVLGIRWSKQPGVGWVDAQPWPRARDRFYIGTAVSATRFDVRSDITGHVAPQAGKTFALYDPTEKKFVRKRILSVTNPFLGVYTLEIDASNSASDVAYVPNWADSPCPFSPSLDLLVAPFLSEVDKCGPGEMVEDFFDEGYRQKRIPENPLEWPAEIRHNSLDGVDDLPQVHDVKILEPTEIPIVPDVGVPGASVNLLVLTNLTAFPI